MGLIVKSIISLIIILIEKDVINIDKRKCLIRNNVTG